MMTHDAKSSSKLSGALLAQINTYNNQYACIKNRILFWREFLAGMKQYTWTI